LIRNIDLKYVKWRISMLSYSNNMYFLVVFAVL